MSEPTQHEVSLGTLQLYVQECGVGAPVLVLHGFTGSSQSMEGVSAALARRHRVIAPDLVGHGRSSAPREHAPYAMEACVDQLDAVLRSLAARPVDVVGYSMGGRAALSLAARHPDAVRRLVLVGASAGLEGAEERAARVAQDEALAARIESEPLERFVDHWMGLPLFASQGPRLGAGALAQSRQQRLSNAPHGLAGSLRGMGTGAQAPLHDRLNAMSHAALLVAGDEDAKFLGIAHGLADRMPNAQVCVIPEAGHAAHLENPAAFADAALAFLGAPTA